MKVYSNLLDLILIGIDSEQLTEGKGDADQLNRS